MTETFQVKLIGTKKDEIAAAAKECDLTSSSFVRMAIKEKIDRMKKE